MSLSNLLQLVATCSLAGLSQAAARSALNETTHHGAAVNSTNSNSHKSQSPHGLLTIPLKRVDHKGVATPSLARRFFKTDVLGIYGAAYVGELTIGTSSKPQVVDVLLDTGSFELWVNPDCATSNVPELCTALGHYDPSLSSTSRMLGADFAIKYGSGGTSGVYYTDDIYISGIQIKDQQFGVSNSSELVWFGIMGLGHGQGNGFINYPLVVDSLAAQGMTNSKLFSLDLGGQVRPSAAVTGEIVFGGVNTNKYSGNLAKVPTDPSDPHYVITLTSLSHRAPNAISTTPLTDSNLPLRVVVDSGTTLSLLPESVVAALAARFPGAAPDGNGGYTVPCALQGVDGAVNFGFGGDVTISVRYRDFIWNSGGACFLGAWYTPDIGVWILGDTFLRGAYVTFDQSDNALYMANYISCSNTPNLVAVPAGPDAAAGIPGSCQVGAIVAPSVSVSPSSATPASFPGGSVSSTAIPSAVSSLGATINPVGPASSSSSSSSASSSSLTIFSAFPFPTASFGPVSNSISTSTSGSAPTTASPSPLRSTTALNDPAATSPAQGGSSGSSSGGAASAAAGPQRVAQGSTVIDATGTITSTITRTVMYTVTACAASAAGDCTPGAVSASVETVITTVCPEDETSAAGAGPTAAAPPVAVPAPAGAGKGVGGSAAAGGSGSVGGSSGATVSGPGSKPAVGGSGPVVAPAAGGSGPAVGESEAGSGPSPSDSPDSTAPEASAIPPAGAAAITAAAAAVTEVVSEHCSTSTYTISSCAPTDGASCTLGATTTRVLTLFETISVRPLPSFALGLNGSMGVAGFGFQQSACASCSNGVGPLGGYAAATGGVPVTAGAQRRGLGLGAAVVAVAVWVMGVVI